METVKIYFSSDWGIVLIVKGGPKLGGKKDELFSFQIYYTVLNG